MNVLMLTPDFYPVWGGVGSYVNQIAKKMPKNHVIHILTPKRTQYGNKKLFDQKYLDNFPENVQIHQIGESKDTFFYNFTFQLNCRKVLKKIVRSFDIDIIHSQSSMPDLFVSPKKLGIPIVTTIHTTIEGQINTMRFLGKNFGELDFSEKMTKCLAFPLKHIENKYYDTDRNYITVSNWSKKEIIKQKKIDEDKIKVIHNGVEPKRFDISKKYSKKFFPELYDIESPKILYLSRLIKSKGIDYLTKAAPKILENMDAHFIFAGPGKKPELNIPRENYTFLGYVPYENTPFLHKLSDIFILPSLYENCPMSILEAMASSKGVITSNVGGIPELINDKNGILIPAQNSDIIAESILKLLNNEGLKTELAKNAKKTVQNDFNVNDSIKKTINYYEEVLRK
jgi:glycosyltransferase involved in cell wall biosynthesis